MQIPCNFMLIQFINFAVGARRHFQLEPTSSHDFNVQQESHE